MKELVSRVPYDVSGDRKVGRTRRVSEESDDDGWANKSGQSNRDIIFRAVLSPTWCLLYLNDSLFFLPACQPSFLSFFLIAALKKTEIFSLFFSLFLHFVLNWKADRGKRSTWIFQPYNLHRGDENKDKDREKVQVLYMYKRVHTKLTWCWMESGCVSVKRRNWQWWMTLRVMRVSQAHTMPWAERERRIAHMWPPRPLTNESAELLLSLHLCRKHPDETRSSLSFSIS